MSKKILIITRPISLLLASLSYTLGAGIAHYLGQAIRAGSFALGLLAILALLEADYFFNEYFLLNHTPLFISETFPQRESYRIILLQIAFAALTLSLVAILSLLLTHSLNISVGILLVIIIIILGTCSVPPMILSKAGFGELIYAFTLGTMCPAIGYFLQYGRFHRLLPFTTLPLTLLALAYFLVCAFPSYATDQKLGRMTILIRLTWQRAIQIHHLIIMMAFLIFGVSYFMNFPWDLVWPVFLSLPFAILQIYLLQRIAHGDRPKWNYLTALAGVTFGLNAYLLSFTFWIH
jgi:1,4-dihydroxy-2-naphthoate octaprenyltransferase